MGDYLDAVDLGADHDYSDIKASNGFTCISSTKGKLRCFGRNDEGQLGLGDTNNRGDESNEMGDFMNDVDLGTGFNISATDMPSGYGGSHSIIIDNDLDVKAWGSNTYGQCGNGDESGDVVGDESNEMGDYLGTLDLERVPTALPTTDPSGYPTAAPTSIPEPHFSLNAKSTCSVWDDEVKCWGDRSVVDPTYAGTTKDPAYWYRPQIDALDIGDDFTPDSVSCGRTHQCALSINGTVRCWGDNRFVLCP